MKKLFTFFALTVMGFVAAFAEGEESTETATATIIVNTGEKYEEEPVEGALVTFLGNEYTTPENGTVVITGLNVDDVLGKAIAFTAYKDGYEVFEGEVDFTEGYEGYGIATLTPSEVTLTFKVTDAEYEPIEGAMVTFQDQEYTTAENGEVTVKGLNGPDVIGKELPFSVYKDGYAWYEGVALIDMLEAKTWVQLVAEEATLTIKVITGEDNDPVAGAYVTFNDGEYYSDENGDVKITGISAPAVIGKTFPVTVYKDGYEFFEGVADFSETMEAYVIAELHAAAASLTILVFADEEPVEGAYVTFNDEEYYSDENGSVKIIGISAPAVIGKTLPVTVYKDGYEFFEGEADFTETMDAYVVVDLQAAEATLTVKVMDGDDPVVGAYVTFNDGEYYSDENGEVKITGISAPAVIGKTFPVTVYKDGYEFFEGVADFSETMEAYVVVELQAAEATLTVKVMDGDDPVAGATVTFNGEEYTSDENGDVKITGISAPEVIGKTFPVTVTKDGYKTFEGVADFSETMDAFVIAELENIQTAIYDILADPENSDVKAYDLKGRRVAHPQNGQIYIINGQKVLLKR